MKTANPGFSRRLDIGYILGLFGSGFSVIAFIEFLRIMANK